MPGLVLGARYLLGSAGPAPRTYNTAAVRVYIFTKTSAPALLPCSSSLFSTADFLQTELVMHRANQDPHAYGLVDDMEADATRKSKLLPRVELNVAQKAANWCYVNPFKMVGKRRQEKRR